MSGPLRGMPRCVSRPLLHPLHSKTPLSAGWRRVAMMVAGNSSRLGIAVGGSGAASRVHSTPQAVQCRCFSLESTPPDGLGHTETAVASTTMPTPQWDATESIEKSKAAQSSDSDGDAPEEVRNVYNGIDLYATNVLTTKLSLAAVHQGLPNIADITVVDTRKLKSSRHRIPPRTAIRRILSQYQKHWSEQSESSQPKRPLVIVVKSDLVTSAKAQKLQEALSAMVVEASGDITVAVLVSRRSLRIGHLFVDTVPEEQTESGATTIVPADLSLAEQQALRTHDKEDEGPISKEDHGDAVVHDKQDDDTIGITKDSVEESSGTHSNNNNNAVEEADETPKEPQEPEEERTEGEGTPETPEDSLDDDFSRLAEDEAEGEVRPAAVAEETLDEDSGSNNIGKAEEEEKEREEGLSSGGDGEHPSDPEFPTAHTPEEEEVAMEQVAQEDDVENSDNSEDDNTEACIVDEANDSLAFDAEVQGELSAEEIREHMKILEEQAVMEGGFPQTSMPDIEEEKKVDDYEGFLEDHSTAEQEECVPPPKPNTEKENEVNAEEEENGEAYEELSQELSAAAGEEAEEEVVPSKSAEECDVEIPPADAEESTPGTLEASTVAELEAQSFIADVRDAEQTQPEAPEIKEEVDPGMLEVLERAMEVEEVEESGKEHAIPQDVDEAEEKQGNERTPFPRGDDGNGAAESFVYLSTTPVGCRPLASRAVQSRQSEHLIDTSPFLPFFAYSFASTATERKVTKAKGTADALRNVLLSRRKKNFKTGDEDIDVTELLSRDAEDEGQAAAVKRGRPPARRFPRVVHSAVPPVAVVAPIHSTPADSSVPLHAHAESSDSGLLGTTIAASSSSNARVPKNENVEEKPDYERHEEQSRHVATSPLFPSSRTSGESEKQSDGVAETHSSSFLSLTSLSSSAERRGLDSGDKATVEPTPISVTVEHPFPPEPASIAPKGGLPINKLPLELESSFPPTSFDVIEKIIKEVQEESAAPPRKRRSSSAAAVAAADASSSAPLTAMSMKNNQLFTPDTTRTTLPTPLTLQYDTFSNFLIKTLDSSENPSIRKALEEKKMREKAEEEKLKRELAALPKRRQMTAGHILQKMVARRRRRNSRTLLSSVNKTVLSVRRGKSRLQLKRRVQKKALRKGNKAERGRPKKKPQLASRKKIMRKALTKSKARKIIRRLRVAAKRKR